MADEKIVLDLARRGDCRGTDIPIWNLVESYPMKDGKMPGESIYPYNVQTFWQNRDPRFNATIAYNASIFPLGVSDDHKVHTDINSGDGFNLNQGTQWAPTGFYCRKGIDNSLTVLNCTSNGVDWIEIRFAEVLLNFAEAANETSHEDEALAVLKAIRQRAGIEPGLDGMYGLKTGMSREQLRDAIYFERYIEFTFEGKRFWDLRRTRRLGQLDGVRKFGVLAVLDSTLDPVGKPANYFNSNDFHYTVTELPSTGAKTMVTPDSYYFLPISEDELQKNPNLEQNQDWGGTFDPKLH